MKFHIILETFTDPNLECMPRSSLVIVPFGFATKCGTSEVRISTLGIFSDVPIFYLRLVAGLSYKTNLNTL